MKRKMSTLMLPLGKRIKELRRAIEMNQGELGKLVGTDARMISQYEKGKTLPSAETIVKIAKIFNVTTDYLLLEDAPRQPFMCDNNKEISIDLADIEKLPVAEKKALSTIINALSHSKP
jgi:transcriptional regulator with XRE-family HTH domain